MKKEIKEKWIEALRSGQYKQGYSALKTLSEFCCLGVLTDLYIKEHPEEGDWVWVKSNNNFHYEDGVCFLPRKVAEWADIKNNGSFDEPIRRNDEDYISLIDLNDSEFSFKIIAEIIEQFDYNIKPFQLGITEQKDDENDE